MIKRIKIRDFKSIRELDLPLDPVTVLIGRSGTGKSNLVQALRFLRNLLLNYEEAILNEWSWERIVPVGEERPKTSIEVNFSIPGEEREYNYLLRFGAPGQHKFPANNIHLKEERLSFGKELIFARKREDSGQWIWEKAPNVSPAVPPHEERPMVGRFPSLQQAVFANAALSSGIGYYHFPANALGLDMTPNQRTPQLNQSVPGLSDTGANYLGVIRNITQDFHRPDIRKNLLASLRAVNASIESVELDSLLVPQKAVIGHRARDRIFSLFLEQESDGLRRFYAHLLALYQTPSKLALIFEEPENAIFPGALSLLADEFKAAPREDRGQVIITTHSPTLLDSFDVDNIRIVDICDGQTSVGSIAMEQRQAVKEHLLSTGDLLTVDNARLDKVVKAP